MVRDSTKGREMKTPKNKASKPEEIYSLARFRFCLPGHYQFDSVMKAMDLKPDESRRVVDNIYRTPEAKIEAAQAAPLDGRENAAMMISLYTSPTNKKDVVTTATDAEKALVALLNLARAGDGKALWQFADITRRMVSAINEIAKENPDALKPIARNLDRWPLQRSTAPLLCDDDALLKKIELGMATGLQLDKYSKWKPDYAAMVASKLREHIENTRKDTPLKFEDGKKITLQPLPPFSKDSAPQWWTVAERFLLVGYPKPEEIAQLDAMVTAKSKRKYPSTRRVAILEKIRARFESMALVA